MKKLLVALTLLSSLSVYALSIECYQGDGDDRYDLKFQDDLMVIVHTNDSDQSEQIYYGSATYYGATKTISGGRYIVNLADDLRDDSSLYQLLGRQKYSMTNILECRYGSEYDIDLWVK